MEHTNDLEKPEPAACPGRVDRLVRWLSWLWFDAPKLGAWEYQQLTNRWLIVQCFAFWTWVLVSNVGWISEAFKRDRAVTECRKLSQQLSRQSQPPPKSPSSEDLLQHRGGPVHGDIRPQSDLPD